MSDETSEWTRLPFRDVVQNIVGGFSVNAEDRARRDGELGVLKTGCVAGPVLDLSEHKAVFPNEHGRVRTHVKAGTLVFCRKNSEAAVGLSSVCLSTDERLFLSDLLWQIRPALDVDLAWFAHLVRSDRFRNEVLGRTSGTHATMRNISQDRLLSIPIDRPPLSEQRRIAAALDAWDEGIVATEGLSAAKRRQFEYLRATVLTGRVRLPSFADEWVTVRISDVLTEHGLLSTGHEEVFSVSVHRGLVNQVEHLGRSFAASSIDHYRRVQPGDVVYTKSPTGDFPLGIIKQSKVSQDVIVSPLYGVFTPETPALGTILDAYFSAPSAAQSYLAPLVQKGAKNTIAVTNDRFLEGSLRLPRDRYEQEALSTLVSVALLEITQIDTLADHLRLQKRGLMQKLLTGAWRVPASADALMPGGCLVAEAAE